MILKEACELIVDCPHKTAPIQETGYPSIRTPNIGKGRLILENVNRVSEKTYLEWTQRAIPMPKDIILAREAPVGNAAVIPDNLKVCLGQRTVLIRANPSIVLPDYLVYLLLGDGIQNKIQALSAGATVAHLNMSDIRNFELPELPSLPTQQKIAAILSAYDDLIENNTRRIQILEEMARRIYREWFVHFRFPGHENVKMVDSELGKIPEGWEVRNFDDISEFIIDGDWIETKDQGGEDFRLLQISNIGINAFVETGNFRYITSETFNKLKCTEIIQDDILIARMPKPIGRAWLAEKMPWRMVTAVDVAIMRINQRVVNKYYCINFINSPINLKRAKNHSTGTTRPRITRRDLIKFPILVPPFKLQNFFSENVDSNYTLISILRIKNENLRKTRDLLLPKLISGKIDVSDLEIKI